MMALAYYLIKVFICSGILFFYYHLALKNKAFHQWNRFYLLSAVVMSLALPLFQFIIPHSTEEQSKAIQLIQVVQSADNYLEEFTISSPSAVTPEQWTASAYASISFAMLCGLILSVYKILRISRTYGFQQLQKIRFVNTVEPGTPFSFLNYIFWNRNIPLQSEAGRHIFQHEVVHVEEKHTLDKLFLQLVLIPFWCIPFFWLMRRELKFVHEFIADRKAVGENGSAAFAAMILQAAYPQQYNSITNPFFQTSIKRRLTMLTKIHNPAVNYISRIVALPLIAVTIFAFTFRTKPVDSTVHLDKEIIVAIDAGHGFKNGKPTGVRINEINEDALMLQLAEKIKMLNKNENIRIVFTRSDENWIELKDRVATATNANADIFISLHVNAAEASSKNNSGIEVYLPPAASSSSEQSRTLGSAILANLGTIYKTNSSFLQRSTGIYVLDKNLCPAVLVEVGYLTNDKDRNFIVDEKNQRQVAQQILTAIESYAAKGNADKLHFKATDTIPKKGREISSVNVNKAEEKLTISYTDGTSEVLSVPEARKKGLLNDKGVAIKRNSEETKNSLEGHIESKGSAQPIYLVDGTETTKEGMAKLDPNLIQSVNVLKGKSATEKYGDKATNGAVEITMKKAPSGAMLILQDDGKPVLKGNITKLDVGSGGIVSIEANNVISIQETTELERDGSYGTYDASKISQQPIIKKVNAPAPVYIVDGNETSSDLISAISPSTIKSMNVLKGVEAAKKYGNKGVNGAVEITLNK